jgi:hypothetical protein
VALREASAGTTWEESTLYGSTGWCSRFKRQATSSVGGILAGGDGTRLLPITRRIAGDGANRNWGSISSSLLEDSTLSLKMLFAIILLAPAAIASFPHERPPGSCGNGVF